MRTFSFSLRAIGITMLVAFSGTFSTLSLAQNTVTLESLLDEMVSVEEQARMPDPYYTSHQESSYDRASVSADRPGWFANNDGFGVMRVDTVGGRIEKVMLDAAGPGAITRIWITTIDKRGTWRFYFDGSDTPGLVIPAYDLMRLPVAGIGRGLVQPHTSYTPEGKGGNTSFLPIPYAKACKVTFEDEPGVQPTPKYYHINYRKYAGDVTVETFSGETVARAAKKIVEVDHRLLNPAVSLSAGAMNIPGKSVSGGAQGKAVRTLVGRKLLSASDSLSITLPKGENAVYELSFSLNIADSAQYAQVMRELILIADFDKKQTVWAPLSDFSGGGMGAPRVESWYLSADGKGKITSRWLMPYRRTGTIRLLNLSSADVDATVSLKVSPLRWDKRSLYFHTSWRRQDSIYIHNRPEEADKCIEWNFATIHGRGIYKGDLLSLFNHAPRWYGEGDEKIWVDNDKFPSHFGTGTEDYYNSSWAPVYPFHTPFGGAPCADMESSHGYNSFYRTRHLDGITFERDFRFDIEMLGWDSGYADYATTVYWYGDYTARFDGASGMAEAKRRLLPVPYNPAKYTIPNSIEFETLTCSEKSPGLRMEQQGMLDFPNGKWSKAKHLLGAGGKPGDFVEFTFDGLKEDKYRLVLYTTLANDYATVTFDVNDTPTGITFDGYHETVTNSEAISLGDFTPRSGQLKLKVKITGTNTRSVGVKYLIGLDCVQLIPVK